MVCSRLEPYGDLFEYVSIGDREIILRMNLLFCLALFVAATSVQGKRAMWSPNGSAENQEDCRRTDGHPRLMAMD
ncbi:hypothetical protein MAR_027996, partial [Mya arenaria]